MENLVELVEGQVMADSRKVAEVFGMEHKNVLRSINGILAAQNCATKLFTESSFENRGKQYPMYLMNRDGFTLLAMGFTGQKAMEWKLKYIDAFNRMEQRLKEIAAPTPMEQMAQGILAAQKVLAEKEKHIKALEGTIEESKPKVVFADAVSASKHSILVGELAKLLKQNGVNTGQKRLFQWLRGNGYLMRTGSSKNMPTQRSMEQGLFEIKEGSYLNGDGVNIVTKTTKVTGKGQIYFINKLKEA